MYEAFTWIGEKNPLGPPAEPTKATPIGPKNLNGLESRIASAFQVINLGTDWSAGELISGQLSLNVAGHKMDMRDGTKTEPMVLVLPTLKVSRREQITRAAIGVATGNPASDGAAGLAAIHGSSGGGVASEAQAVGIFGGATNESNAEGTNVQPDAAGGYFQGRITGGTGPNASAYGIVANGRRDVATAIVNGAEIQVQNYTETAEVYNPNGSGKARGIWLPAAGTADSAVGLAINNPFGRQFEVGIGFGNTVTGGKTGGIKSAAIRDDSSGEVSFDIRGTHSKAAVSVAKGSGPVIIGAQELTTTTSQLLELHAGGEARLPILKITAGGNVSTSILFNNSTAQYSFGQVGVKNQLLEGTEVGDGAVAMATGKSFHVGRTGSRATLRVGNNIRIGSGAEDSFGGGVGVVFVANAGTVPSSNPVGGGIFYVQEGALKYRGPSGTITTIAAA